VSYRVWRVPEEATGSRGRWNHGRLPLSQKKLPERVSRRGPGGVTHKIGGDSVHAVGVGKGGSAPRYQKKTNNFNVKMTVAALQAD
jgi:hypothetical protein